MMYIGMMTALKLNILAMLITRLKGLIASIKLNIPKIINVANMNFFIVYWKNHPFIKFMVKSDTCNLNIKKHFINLRVRNSGTI